MPTLAELFNGLSLPPKSSSPLTELSACPIPGITGHRIARNSVDQPSLLVKTTSERDLVPPPIRLENLAVEHGVRCKIWQGNHLVEEDTYTVLTCLSEEVGIRSQFLGVGAPFLNCLGPNPTPQQVSHFLGMLVELFRALSQPARKSVQGLWGELFLISHSHNIETMLNAWHINPNERYDFSRGNFRIEVKCCLGRERRHHFSLQQLLPPVQTNVLVASICTERIGGGVSVNELLAIIRSRLSGSFTLLLRLEAVVAATLGETMLRALEDSFDLGMAQETLRFFKADAIPKPHGDIPPEVSDLRFVADLTNIESTELGDQSHMDDLIEAVQPS